MERIVGTDAIKDQGPAAFAVLIYVVGLDGKKMDVMENTVENEKSYFGQDISMLVLEDRVSFSETFFRNELKIIGKTLYNKALSARTG